MKKFLLLITLFLTLTLNAQTVISTESGHWTATYYGDRYKTVRKTASGERFNKDSMTCAAPRKFKFGTKLRITNLANNKSVIVRVNDRGAFGQHTIDLTHGAFDKIAKHKHGRVKIKVEVLKSNKGLVAIPPIN